jgi:L-2-hydroxyglutarate oxidase
MVRDLQRLVPEVQAEDLTRSRSGVRAQAVDSSGKLVDDFRIVEAPQMLHLLNAPSPGATSSLRIGETLAERALKGDNSV